MVADEHGEVQLGCQLGHVLLAPDIVVLAVRVVGVAVGVARCLLQGQFPVSMQILIDGAGGGANTEGGGLGVN